ncbi:MULTISPECIES: nucleotidyltransferase domain-containing protein [unclassified Lebetimonas]|uniref:nucleotidyltransferase domain-containing protein n=1 Tax=unclassified Lebetimonas TaxID=2648158 RepID=UPI000464261B|nr:MULTISPECIES: nucleotidyltransferase domain-containing protein [unclassified Lebetimonas]
MRLSEKEILSIKKAFVKIFKNGEIYLFGSRVDDNLKGGDIDLYIVSSNANLEKKIEFLVYLKKLIGDRKIDVVINKKGLIEKNAKKGILLWKN